VTRLLIDLATGPLGVAFALALCIVSIAACVWLGVHAWLTKPATVRPRNHRVTRRQTVKLSWLQRRRLQNRKVRS
jgi:hypothetical protein